MPVPESFIRPYADRFANGTCEACPTALDVVKDAGVVGKMAGKVIVITGCTAGIGIETARALHKTGAKLYLTVRDVKKGEEIAKEITSSSGSDAPIEVLRMDLSSLKSVRAAAEEFLAREKTLNILVNNAGKSDFKS